MSIVEDLDKLDSTANYKVVDTLKIGKLTAKNLPHHLEKSKREEGYTGQAFLKLLKNPEKMATGIELQNVGEIIKEGDGAALETVGVEGDIRSAADLYKAAEALKNTDLFKEAFNTALEQAKARTLKNVDIEKTGYYYAAITGDDTSNVVSAREEGKSREPTVSESPTGEAASGIGWDKYNWYSPEQQRKDQFGNIKEYYPPFVPDSRIAPISPDEIMNCIRTVQKRLHVDPETLNELFRLAYSRARIVSSLARHVYPEFPTLIEWSMLRKMMIKWHYPVKCLIANAGSATGEPKYQASCFRPGTLMMGAHGPNTLYVAVGRGGETSGEATALRWMRIRDDGYSGTGKRLAERCYADVSAQFKDDTVIDREIWQSVGASAVDMAHNTKAMDQKRWMDFMQETVAVKPKVTPTPVQLQNFNQMGEQKKYDKRVPASYIG